MSDHQLKINEIYAYIATETDGKEGVLGGIFEGRALPFIGADLSRMESLRPYAQLVADEKGIDVKMVHFKQRVDVKTLVPNTDEGEKP